MLRQKKVAKEKATPGSAPGVARSLALLGRPGGCATRGCAPQTVLAESPRPACVAQRLSGGGKASRGSGSAREKAKRVFFGGRPLEKGKNHPHWSGGDAFPGPHVERRATQLMADKGRGLFEARRAEFRSPRQQRVAQGSRRSRPRSLGSPSSLATFFLAKQEESTPARKAEQSRQTRTTSPVAKTNSVKARKIAIKPRSTAQKSVSQPMNSQPRGRL